MSLPLLCLSRAGTCVAAMAYAGALPFLRQAWNMDAATAGSVQAVYNVGVAVSLLVGSWLADRVGAKRVFLASSWAAILAYGAFAAFARSHDSALWLMALVAVTQGGAYTPALMLVAELVPSARRGIAMGALLAAGSFGYLLSVLGALGGAALVDYRFGFALCAAGPMVGAVAGTLALKGRPNLIHCRHGGGPGLRAVLLTRVSLLLTLGYIAHTWELLGLWGWLPAFLAANLGGLGLGPLATGLAVASAVHLAGITATLSMGLASDRLGRRTVLVGAAVASGALSALLGWSQTLPAPAILLLAFAVSFAAYGDSGVLSTALTESVPARHLGTVLALRSILGFGAGAVSPVAFGIVLDLGGGWGWAFTTLAAGGIVATVAALALPRTESASGP
jgi:MFS family permease